MFWFGFALFFEPSRLQKLKQLSTSLGLISQAKKFAGNSRTFSKSESQSLIICSKPKAFPGRASAATSAKCTTLQISQFDEFQMYHNPDAKINLCRELVDTIRIEVYFDLFPGQGNRNCYHLWKYQTNTKTFNSNQLIRFLWSSALTV